MGLKHYNPALIFVDGCEHSRHVLLCKILGSLLLPDAWLDLDGSNAEKIGNGLL